MAEHSEEIAQMRLDYSTDQRVWDVLSEVERLRKALTTALADLDEEHQPQWTSDEAKAKGKAPIGCALCWPGDGHWPCTSRLIADDLRAALSDSPVEEIP